MGYRLLISILLVSLLSMSCSAINYSTQPDFSKRNYSTLKYLGAKHISNIILLDDEIVTTNYVHVVTDSLFYEVESDTISISIDKINTVEIEQLSGAIAAGIGLSSISILSLFLIAGTITGSGLGGLVAVFYLGLPIGVLGFVVGENNGGTTKYIFNDKANYEQIEYYKNYNDRKAKQDSINLGR